MPRDPKILLRGATIAIAIVLALTAAVQLDGKTPVEGEVAPAATNDPLRAALVRCRTITPEDLAVDTACQAAWAENRRRFFAPVGDTGDGREEE